MSSVYDDFPWKKNGTLFNESAERLEKRLYENWVIFRFGIELANEDLDVIFRDEYPDAILVRKRNGHFETLAIEFEEHSGNFKDHKHDPQKCDLIVCAFHDWPERFPNEKCPLPVYVVAEQKFYPKEG